MYQLYFKTNDEWRKWLSENHSKVKEVWLIFYKKETKKLSINYGTAVEEALCFGWIDSLVKKIDDKRYVRKFTPRNIKSVWSDSNKKRVKKVIKEGRMTEYGLEKINVAKKNGSWNKKIKTPTISYEVPNDFITLLDKHKRGKINFERLALSYKKRYYLWINTAKKKETRERRIKESIKLLSSNKGLGLK